MSDWRQPYDMRANIRIAPVVEIPKRSRNLLGRKARGKRGAGAVSRSDRPRPARNRITAMITKGTALGMPGSGWPPLCGYQDLVWT